jgi:rubredoxin
MTVYHPDPEINAGVAADALDAERADLAAGYPPRRWVCPKCAAEHGRGHFLNIGQHRCLRCGYVGTGGVMVGPPSAES